MSSDLSVVLVSGGMDSCVTAAIAARSHRLALLHVQYGQRTEARELRAFQEIAGHFGARHRLVVSIGYLAAIGGSALTDASLPVPDAAPGGGSAGPVPIPSTYVPFRNAHFLSIATSWAEVIGARWIQIGAVEEDGSGYPDCREIFYEAFNRVIETGTRPDRKITIVTPVIHLRKADIVRKGMELGAPLHLTWSCYRESERACGTCESCVLRLKGFREAGIQDPLPYAR